MTAYMWQILILAVMAQEAPKTAQQAAAAIKREGAYGCLQIRQCCLDDVNRRFRNSKDFKPISLKDVQSSDVLSRWVFVQYTTMYGAKTMEEAARIWNGGPRGPSKKATVKYWQSVQRHIASIQKSRAKQLAMP